MFNLIITLFLCRGRGICGVMEARPYKAFHRKVYHIVNVVVKESIKTLFSS